MLRFNYRLKFIERQHFHGAIEKILLSKILLNSAISAIHLCLCLRISFLHVCISFMCLTYAWHMQLHMHTDSRSSTLAVVLLHRNKHTAAIESNGKLASICLRMCWCLVNGLAFGCAGNITVACFTALLLINYDIHQAVVAHFRFRRFLLLTSEKMRLAIVAHFRFRRFLLLTSEKKPFATYSFEVQAHISCSHSPHHEFRISTCMLIRAPYEEFELKFAKHRCEIRFRLHRLTSEKLRVIWTVRVIFSLYQYRT